MGSGWNGLVPCTSQSCESNKRVYTGTPRCNIRSPPDGGAAVQPPGLSYTAHWEALGCALCLLDLAHGPGVGSGLWPQLQPPTCSRRVRSVGLGPFCHVASLPRSPGPCWSVGFCSAISDCLSLNASFTLTTAFRKYAKSPAVAVCQKPARRDLVPVDKEEVIIIDEWARPTCHNVDVQRVLQAQQKYEVTGIDFIKNRYVDQRTNVQVQVQQNFDADGNRCEYETALPGYRCKFLCRSKTCCSFHAQSCESMGPRATEQHLILQTQSAAFSRKCRQRSGRNASGAQRILESRFDAASENYCL
jgi:hypothetical protein